MFYLALVRFNGENKKRRQFRLGGDMKIFIWNVGKSTILTTIECHPEVILSVSWNLNGSRIVTSCKDKYFRVINPRTGQVMKVELIGKER
jgi:WD40 repeat protein